MNPFKKKYESVEQITPVLEQAKDVKDIANLYYVNAELVEDNRELKNKFTEKKNQFFRGHRDDLCNAAA